MTINPRSPDKYVFSMQRKLQKNNPIARALTSFRAQLARCTNRNNFDFKHYGGKGIKVIYDKDAFVDYWVSESKKYPVGTKLTVDRKNTDGNYSFGNIQIIPWVENVCKSNYERAQKIDVYRFSDGCFVETITGLGGAFRLYGATTCYVNGHMKKRHKSPPRGSKMYTFRKHGDTF
jgi:predicted SnoaL-like aldol condensation-catalyzing enzyme